VDPRTHQAHHHHSASASYAVLWEGVKHASGEQVSVHTVVEDWSAMVAVFGTGALPVGELRAFAPLGRGNHDPGCSGAGVKRGPVLLNAG
jgi:hypothetical protein